MKTLYAARFVRVTENLARQGLTQMIVSDPPTIFYLTGVRIQPGERIAQLVIMPVCLPHMELADSLKETERGGGGFGSTGRQ